MTIKEKYEIVKNEFSMKDLGTYEIIELMKTPRFMDDSKKYKEIKKNCTFPYELTSNATEQDYKEYVEFVLNYCGYSVDEIFYKK